MAKIVYNAVLGGWFVVRGPHQTPIGGRFESKAAAQASLDAHKAAVSRTVPRMVADLGPISYVGSKHRR